VGDVLSMAQNFQKKFFSKKFTLQQGMFCDKQSSFEGNVFNNFIALINIAHEKISFHWITNLNTIINHLVFEFVGQNMWATSSNQTRVAFFVTKDIYGNVVAFMK
jgi:hypothetical protein